VVERQTQVAERRSTSFRLNLLNKQKFVETFIVKIKTRSKSEVEFKQLSRKISPKIPLTGLEPLRILHTVL